MALTEKQKAIALDIATGVSQRASAQLHGIHYMTITLWKRRAEFLSEIERLRATFRNVEKQNKSQREGYGS